DVFPRAFGVVVHREVDALRDPKRARVAPLLLERGSDDAHLVRELRRRLRSGAEEAVGVPYRPAERVRVVPAVPDRWMWLLERLRLHEGSVELPEASLEADLRLRPE